jgi:transketolase
MEAFERQSADYREAILPKSCERRVAIEAGISLPWHSYVGPNGAIIGVDSFGFSGSASDLATKFGITLENLKNAIELVCA